MPSRPSAASASSTATARPSSWTHERARVDPDRAWAVLQRWLRTRTGTGVEIVDLRAPTENGGTGANVLVTLREGGSERRIVVRADPGSFSHIHEVSVAQQYQVFAALADTAVPVPRPLWLETDPAVLGVPFMVVEHRPGRAPSDFPLYTEAGFLFEATPEYRHILWGHAVDALAQVHSVDPAPFAFLGRPDRGADGLDQHITYLRESLGSALAQPDVPIVAEALDWVERTRPHLRHPGPAWGDARFGNMLFDEDGRVTAVLDWDQASLAGPLADLGWWLLFDRMHAEDYPAPRLPGLGERAETIERWERGTGLHADDVEWFEILSGLRLTIVRLRGEQARAARGDWVPPADNPRSWRRLAARVDAMIRARP